MPWHQAVKEGVKDMRMYDVSNTHASYIISDIFKYSNVVFASPTYNLQLYFPMDTYKESWPFLILPIARSHLW